MIRLFHISDYAFGDVPICVKYLLIARVLRECLINGNDWQFKAADNSLIGFGVINIDREELLNNADLILNRLLYVELLCKCRCIVVNGWFILGSDNLPKVR